MPVPTDLAAAAEHVARTLMAIDSVSPGRGEREAAEAALALITDGVEGYAEAGLDPLPGDRWDRANAYALLPGASRRTLILFGHLDTVGVEDFADLAPLARDPDALAAHLDRLAEIDPALAGVDPGRWLLGRGGADMKAGVAAAIAVLRHLAAGERPPVSVVVLATPDEENESAGAIAAVDLLHRLRARHRLEYLGAVNTDYVSERFAGDTARPVYTGTVGKLLAGFLVAGVPGHAGDPFSGFDAGLLTAALVEDLALDPELGDPEGPPPIQLKIDDGKRRYDTQLAVAGRLELNFVTYTLTPSRLIDRLVERAQRTLDRTLARYQERRARALGGDPPPLAAPPVRAYAATLDLARGRGRGAQLEAALAAERERFTPDTDLRERCHRLAAAAFAAAGETGPAIVVYLAPPFYPAVAPRASALSAALERAAAAFPDVVVAGHFPLLSDMSYLGHQPGLDLAGLADNLPVWNSGYSVPLEQIAALSLPVADVGPYGFGVHRPGERADRRHAFDELPRLLLRLVEELG